MAVTSADAADSITAKQKLGCWLHERWRTELVLAGVPGWHWAGLHNRNETLEQATADSYIPQWQFSSWLTVSRFFPDVGGRLLRHCFASQPVHWGQPRPRKTVPELTVVLPVCGLGRLPQFQACLAGLLGQQGTELEVCVVEHSPVSEFKPHVPEGVRYLFVKNDDSERRFNKSLAMNRAAAASQAPWLLLLDADLMLPADACAEMCQRAQGYDAVRPVRWAFFLDQAASENYIESKGAALPKQVRYIQQHNPGLATLVSREAYWRIGGHDEQFWGWGGEDAEFLDRLKLQKIYPGSYLPVIHLWHSAAPQKASSHANDEQQRQVRAIPPQQRIDALTAKQPGPNACAGKDGTGG